MVVIHQPAVIRAGNAAHELVRIKAGGRTDGDQLARVAIHDDGGGAFLAHALRAVILQLGIDGQLDRGALFAFLARQLAHLSAGAVDLDPAGAGLAAQHFLKPAFDADLAQLEIRQAQDRVRILDPRQVVIGYWTDIAHDMRQIARPRIGPRQRRFRRDPRQGRRVDGDGAELFPGQAIGQHDRRDGAALGKFVAQFGHAGIADRDQLGQPLQHRLDIAARFLAGQGNAVILFVPRHDQAVPVQDQPARRRQQADLDRVAIRQHPVFIGMVQLHRPHLQRQRRHRADLDPGQQKAATGDAPVAVDDIALRFLHPGTLLTRPRGDPCGADPKASARQRSPGDRPARWPGIAG